jgi:predicted RND superfamily exporter protein
VDGAIVDGTGVARCVQPLGRAPSLVSSAIAAGYAVLCLSGFAFHVELGGLVALAMLVSSASALVLLPALIACLRPQFLWTGTASPDEEQRQRAG